MNGNRVSIGDAGWAGHLVIRQRRSQGQCQGELRCRIVLILGGGTVLLDRIRAHHYIKSKTIS